MGPQNTHFVLIWAFYWAIGDDRFERTNQFISRDILASSKPHYRASDFSSVPFLPKPLFPLRLLSCSQVVYFWCLGYAVARE
ncbi:hypothetical protein F0562_016762 [Nyssa sinensis]|uniref:Uncharacterized protein n=1 Tax=Nyssa sinensis TaxID=561372 RepID=A0A5J4ZGK4_9ASTE|nr:hypothetical protein F0562_016762 [Nyssa sinensis]